MGRLRLSTYFSSNAVDNPGVIYGCLHIYAVMLWRIQGSSMVVSIYIEYCWGQPWNYLWLSTYISSNALDNLLPVMLWSILGSSMIVYTYIQYCRRQSRGYLWLSTYIYRNAVDNPAVNYGCLHMYPVMPSTILGSTMVVYIYIQ